MKTYAYKGFDPAGHVARGMVEALNVKEAREKLAHQGVLAESVVPAGGHTARWPFSRGPAFGPEPRAVFYRELAALLKADLPLVDALEILIETPELGGSRFVVAGVRDAIREGAAFASALSGLSTRVTPFEIAILRVGEHAGALDTVLERVATFLEEQQNIREQITTALVYPAMVLLLSVAVAAALLFFMLPLFARILAEAGVALPLLTRAALMLGRGVLQYGLPVSALLLFGVLLLRRRMRESDALKVAMDKKMFYLPLLGRMYKALVNLRFSRTLALLLRGDVPLVEGMQLAGEATGSVWVRQAAAEQATAVRHGSSLADAVRRIPPLSGSLPGWIRAGEAGGALENLLECAAARFSQQWDRLIARSLTFLEPAVLILVGGFVLLLALSILLPILSMNQTLM